MIQSMTNSQRTEWIFQSSTLPVFLTTLKVLSARKGTSMVGSIKCYNKVSCFFFPGWGDTGVQLTATDKLQETVIPIVQSSNCKERMNQTEGLDENLIVCAGGAEEGPCQVCHQI